MSLLDYKPLIESEGRVSRSQVKPLNVYRISSYKTTDGKLKSMGGNDSSLIVVIGLIPLALNDMKINALKISELPPEKFFRWLKGLRKPLDRINIDEYRSLNELLIDTDRSGKVLFERYVKPSPIVYGLKDSIYRTYNFTGIRYISEVRFKTEVLKEELL
jgi:hypothetical protein